MTYWDFGPLISESVRGLTHVLMIVGEYSEFIVVRSEAAEIFQNSLSEHGVPRIIMYDIGKKFIIGCFKRYFVANKSNRNIQCPKLAKKTGMVKGASRTIVEMARSLLLQAKVPKTYCLGPIGTACCLKNPVGTNKECTISFEKHTG